MRISLVIGNYNAYGGGAERWTDIHARMLAARGHEVHLIARQFHGAPEDTICHPVDVGIRGHRRRLAFGDAAAGILRTVDADVVHDMGDGWNADLFMPHHGTRRGSFKHNTRHLPPLLQSARRFANRWVPRYREFRAIERKQYDLGNGKLYLAVSRMIRDHMVEYCHVPPDRIRLVYNGADTQRFRPSDDPVAREKHRLRLDAKEGDTLFLTVAHNFRLKGLDTLLRSMATFVARGERVRLIVVGDGAITQYQSIARSLGCHAAVRFVGDQPDTLAFYQAADAFVLPTYYDPCSLVVLEAMATGLPIITTRLNGIHEIMQPGREGSILPDPGDDEALTNAMQRYLDAERRVEVGHAARRLAESHSIDRMLDHYTEIYEEIVRSKQPDASPVAVGSSAG